MLDTIAPALPFVNSLDLEIVAPIEDTADDAWTDTYADEQAELAEAEAMLETYSRPF